MKYHHAALGGTFDHFHNGHKALIRKALKVAECLTIGVVDGELTSQKTPTSSLEPFATRKQSIIDYIHQVEGEIKVTVIPIYDIFGPTLTDSSIDCLVVSPETLPGARMINRARVEKRQPLLSIEVCQYELDENDKPISASNIRLGKISREGRVYRKILINDYKLNPNQRSELKKPIGKLVANDQWEKMVFSSPLISVGDTTSLLCYKKRLPVAMFVFDDLEKRQPVTESIARFLPSSQIIRTENPSGLITQALMTSLENAYQTHKHVSVRGEEDLAVLPLILLVPLGTIIVYGQPNEGLVIVEVTEEKKDWCYNFLNHQ